MLPLSDPESDPPEHDSFSTHNRSDLLQSSTLPPSNNDKAVARREAALAISSVLLLLRLACNVTRGEQQGTKEGRQRCDLNKQPYLALMGFSVFAVAMFYCCFLEHEIPW